MPGGGSGTAHAHSYRRTRARMTRGATPETFGPSNMRPANALGAAALKKPQGRGRTGMQWVLLPIRLTPKRDGPVAGRPGRAQRDRLTLHGKQNLKRGDLRVLPRVTAAVRACDGAETGGRRQRSPRRPTAPHSRGPERQAGQGTEARRRRSGTTKRCARGREVNRVATVTARGKPGKPICPGPLEVGVQNRGQSHERHGRPTR
jgi:hypothetical protein